MTRPGLVTPARITRFEDGAAREVDDELATEEPLEIRLRAGGETRSVAVTMRTPGNDFELAAGFLYSEGIVTSRDGVRAISYCIDREVDAEQRYNIVNVDLNAAALPELERLERHFTVNSSCGVCGKATIDALQTRADPIADDLRVTFATIAALSERMRAAQRVFSSTGGLHASALFDARGELIVLREDVGRHNALDKLAGWALMENKLPLRETILFVSGRASYELVQKCIVARIPVLCAVSAPSSLAVDLAREFNVTLCGFVRGTRANVYSAPERVSE
ncbi:MAG TPA: formate dehydrogenase accessory sulfurtransferase FdhD [Candidatus Baltobacteraceae bacterium]